MLKMGLGSDSVFSHETCQPEPNEPMDQGKRMETNGNKGNITCM